MKKKKMSDKKLVLIAGCTGIVIIIIQKLIEALIFRMAFADNLTALLVISYILALVLAVENLIIIARYFINKINKRR